MAGGMMLVHNSTGRAFNLVLVVVRVALALVVETVLAGNGGLKSSNDDDDGNDVGN